MRIFASFDELLRAGGEDLGHSDWVTIGEERVRWFADATGDHHWIHLDRERALSAGYGGTLVHGFLTLALIADFMGQIFRVDGVDQVLNYGLDRVRFPTPVHTGSRLRASATLLKVEPVARGAKVSTRYTIEVEGLKRPACVADHHTMQFLNV